MEVEAWGGDWLCLDQHLLVPVKNQLPESLTEAL